MINRYRVILALAVILPFAGTAFSATIHVPADQPTIQAGINAAVNGDTVLVAPGTYDENIVFGGKNIVLLSSAGPISTFIQPAEDGDIINLENNEGPTTEIAGFTIQNSGTYLAVKAFEASPNIHHNIFFNNLIEPNPNTPALFVFGDNNSIIHHNLFNNNGGVANIWIEGSAKLYNNTVVNSQRAGIISYSNNTEIVNNIVVGCPYYGIITGDSHPLVDYNDFYDNNPNYISISPGTHDISIDPLFINPSIYDFNLQLGSPCLDAGDPNPVYNDPDGTRNDMGALPYTQTHKYYISPSGSDETGDGTEGNPFATIQKGVDIAQDGDSVIAMDGEFSGTGNININLMGKSIILNSENGPNFTLIRSQIDYEKIIICQSGEDSLTKIEGLSFRGGDYQVMGNGGLLSITGSSPQFINCRFQYGGLKSSTLSNSKSIFRNCLFAYNFNGYNDSKNTGSTLIDIRSGGALCIYNNSEVILDNCTFSNNEAYLSPGGAIACENSIVHIDSCEFHDNSSRCDWVNPAGGGALYSNNSTIYFTSCIFRSNIEHSYSGGAICCTGNSSAIFNNCEFRDNSSEKAGGAIYSYNSSIYLEYSQFIDNRTINEHVDNSYGGAIFVSNSNLSTFNCLFWGNQVTGSDPDYTYEGSAIFVFGGNTTIDKCLLADNKMGTPIYCESTKNIPALSCTDIVGNQSGDWVGCIADQYGQNGNISLNPMFCDTANADFHIFNISPCAPANNSCQSLIGALGIGCISNQTMWFISANGNDATGDGTEQNPFATIQKGVDMATNGDTVVILEGEYRGMGNRDIDTYGKAILIISASGPAATILNVEGDYSPDNHRGFWIHSGENNNTIIDGLTIKNGVDYRGGGILIESSSPIIRNCRIINNVHQTDDNYGGGGIHVSNGSPIIEYCEIANNHSWAGIGLGICWFGGEALIKNCNIINNDIYADNTTNTRFQGCAILDGDLGIFSKGTNTIIDNCTLMSMDLAIAAFCNTTIERCSIVNNGTAIYFEQTANLIIENSLVAFNDHSIDCYVQINPLITCSDIYGNVNGDWIDCIDEFENINGNFSLDPMFCDAANGDFHIFNISPCAPANNYCDVLIGALDVGCNIPLPNIEVFLMDGQSPAMNLIDHTAFIEWDYIGGETYPQTRFEIAVGTDNDWQYAEMWNPAPFNSPDTFVTYSGAALQDGQTYYLRLRINNGYIWSNWYETTFRMNSVPSIPGLVNPLNDEIVLTATPTLTLQAASDPEGDNLTYDFFYVNDPAFGPEDTNLVFGISDISVFLSSPLNDNWKYYWAARSCDGFEYSAWSAPATFWVNSQPQAPGGFTALNPPGEPPLPIYNMLPAFTWSSSSDPDPFDSVHYALILAADEDFNFALTIDSIWDETYTLTDSLSFATQYWWKVRAKDTYGLTTFSDNIQTFKTWRLGDVNNDWRFDILDIIFTIDYKFKNGSAPNPIYTADVNADCVVNILDIIYMINAKFKTGPDPLVGCE